MMAGSSYNKTTTQSGMQRLQYHRTAACEATSRPKRAEIASKQGGVLKKENSTGSVSSEDKKVGRIFAPSSLSRDLSRLIPFCHTRTKTRTSNKIAHVALHTANHEQHEVLQHTPSSPSILLVHRANYLPSTRNDAQHPLGCPVSTWHRPGDRSHGKLRRYSKETPRGVASYFILGKEPSKHDGRVCLTTS